MDGRKILRQKNKLKFKLSLSELIVVLTRRGAVALRRCENI